MIRRTPVGVTLSTLALVLALAAPARGQIVRGQVVEDGTNSPVEGAMVLLLETDERVVHRVLTDASGGFVLSATHPGPHLVRVDRIGYESLTTERFDVPTSGTFRRIAVPLRPVELAGIDVEGARRCEVRGEQGQATARAWEEARKALEAAAWTLESGAYRYTLLQYVRTLEPDERTVRSEDRRFQRGTGQAPYVSAPPEELAEKGFVRRNADATLTYFAPDAAAFLSDAFLDTHCMRVEGRRDGEIGLAFEPVRGRRLPDIRGNLWLDAATAQLRRLEFTYVNMPPDRDMGNAGGEVLFGRLPNGTWIVRDWNIRMPLLATNSQRTRLYVTGYQVQGGVVWRVSDPGGTTVVEATTASISGTVVDSLGGRAVGGARVETEDGLASDTTGVAGTFFLSGLASGHQTVVVRHPSLDTLGLGPISEAVDAVPGEVTSVRIRLPDVGLALAAACAETPRQDRETAAVLGRVVERGGDPAANARVRVRWLGGDRRGFDATDRAAPRLSDGDGPRWRTDPDDARYLVTELDHRGVFLVCGVPTRTQLRVEVGGVVETVDVPAGRTTVVTSFILPTREP